MADKLELAKLHRAGSGAAAGSPIAHERHTFDFVVNGTSLWKATLAYRSGMCGCLSDPQLEPDIARRFNSRTAHALTCNAADGNASRVALFVCPECGDVGCGAITAQVSMTDLVVRWSDFAYENGYEDEIPLSDLGAFEFDRAAYTAVIGQASSNPAGFGRIVTSADS